MKMSVRKLSGRLLDRAVAHLNAGVESIRSCTVFSPEGPCWSASVENARGDIVCFAHGRTQREAVLRCHLLHQVGEEVEVPGGLRLVGA
jgi:hypothetical protein